MHLWVRSPLACLHLILILHPRYGLLHRIPAQEEREGMLLPSELQEPEDEDDNHKTFIPADVPISHDDAFIHNPSQQSLRTSLATVSETDNTASEDEDEEATFDRSK